MKLLFDQNISRKLISRLADLFPGSEHVFQIGKQSAEDWEIFNFAGNNGYVIASKDTDFRQISFVRGFPPKVISLDVGNCSTDRIEQLFRGRYSDLLKFEADQVASIFVSKD
ncbi:MAG: DUF5615 family PIN-like protein [Gemmataceae bacterium]